MSEALVRTLILSMDDEAIDSIIDTLTKRVQNRLSFATGKVEFDSYVDELRVIDHIRKVFREWKQDLIENTEENIDDQL